MLEIMPENDDQVQVVKASRTLSSADYDELLIPELDDRLSKVGKIKALILFDKSFQGWQPGAAWDDFVYGMRHRHDFEKIAIVTEKRWLGWASRLMAGFIDGQAAVYDLDEFSDALAWVRQ